MSERIYAEQWPAAVFIVEELEFRGIVIDEFLRVVGITPARWAKLLSGEAGMLISECERIGGALGVGAQFIANLNLSYRKWARKQEVMP